MGQLKKILREQILAEMTYERQMSDEEIADLIDRKMDACLEEQLGEFPLTLGERLKLHRELFDSFRRLDILQELVDDPRVTEIMVNGPDQVFVETGGKDRAVGKVFRIQGTAGRSDPADRQQCEQDRQYINAACKCQIVRRIESPCGPRTDRIKRTDLDDPEISGAGDDGTAHGIRKHLKRGSGSLEDACCGALQHLCQRRHRSGKNDTLKCTLRVYPIR